MRSRSSLTMHSLAPRFLLGLVALAGCADIAPAGPRRSHDDAGTLDPSIPVATDLPCDVAQVLADQCWTCHGSTPPPGVPIALVTRADLLRASAIDPAATYADRSVVRMRAATMPMPPVGARAPEAAIAALESWIAAGAPGGSCDVRDPYATPVQCTSGRTWTLGETESPEMFPGAPCVACHEARTPERRMWLGGTIYPSAHEPDDCSGADTGGAAIVEITDAMGRVFEMAPNAAGNFYLYRPTEEDLAPGGALATDFAYPYTARVLLEGRERAMLTPQTSGDCNACHTTPGTMGAPGRVMAP